MFHYKKLLMSAVASTVLLAAGSVAAQDVPAELPYVMADGTRTADYEAAIQSWREDAQFAVDYSKGYLGLEHAYARGLSGKGVTVGVNDSGVYWDHPLFQGRNNGLDTETSDALGNFGSISSEEPWHNHGTHVAGTAVGRRLADQPMFGNAYNADIYSSTIHFLGQNYAFLEALFKGEPLAGSVDNLVKIAEGQHARIINNSWGVPIRSSDFANLRYDASLEDMEARFAGVVPTITRQNWQAVVDSDAIVVFSAGNEGQLHATQWGMTPHFVPEVKSNFLTVANYDAQDIQNGSNLCGHAATWCLAGPGTDIVSSITDYDFDNAQWAADFPYQTLVTYPAFMAGYRQSTALGLATQIYAFFDDFAVAKANAEANGVEFDAEAEANRIGREMSEFMSVFYAFYLDPGSMIGVEVDFIYEMGVGALEFMEQADAAAIIEAYRAQFLPTYQQYMSEVRPGYAAFSGTSMAAPNISGFTALLIEQFPEYGSGLITDILLSSGRDIEEEGVDIRAGWGVPQMGDALNGPSALRALREVAVAGGTKDVWSNDITDAVDRYSAIVRERNPDDIGGLTKVGGGELQLTGSLSYTGPTRVEGGLLTVDGEITRSVSTVAANGIIGGTGSLASLVADAGGVVAPGNSDNPFGTLTVTGDAEFLPGSYLWVRSGVNGTPHSKLAVQGATTLEGGSVILKADQGVWNLRVKDMEILTSAGGVTGQFEGATSDLAFLTPSLRYTDDAVYMTLLRNDVSIASAGENANQRAVGTALDAMTAANSSGNLALEDAILDGSFEAVSRALYSLTGEVHASLGAVATADTQLIRDAMLDRGRGAPVAGLSTPLNARGLNFWASGVHSEGRFDGTTEHARFRSAGNGFAVGIDKTVERGHFGIAYGENTSELDRHRLSSSAKTRSRHVGVYGGATLGEFALRAGGSWFETNSDTRRGVQLNAFSERLTGDYDGDGWQAYVEGAWSRNIGSTALEPYVNYTRVDYSADVRETGGDAALSGDFSETADLLTAGIRSRTLVAGGNGRPALTLVGHLAWTENLNDDGAVYKARFAYGPVFDVTGQSLAGDALQTSVSVNVQTTERTAFDIGYAGTHSSDYSNNRLFGRFSVKF